MTPQMFLPAEFLAANRALVFTHASKLSLKKLQDKFQTRRSSSATLFVVSMHLGLDLWGGGMLTTCIASYLMLLGGALKKVTVTASP